MTVAARQAFEEAVALENAGHVDKALVSYLKAQELSPEDTEIAYRTASALLQNGYLEEAQSQLRRIVFAEPDHIGARASLGNCQLLMGDTANAKQNFCEVLERTPDNRNALYGLASVLLKDGQPEDAAVAAKRLAELLPDSAAVLTLFAETQERISQTATAIAAYRKALKTDPAHFPALIGLAQTLLRRKRYDEVIGLALRASEMAQADAVPLELLADALMGKSAFEDAFEAAEAARKLSPRSPANLVRLSILSRKLGDYPDALRHALKAHDLDATNREALNALGSALAAMKYPLQARTVLTGLPKGIDPAIRSLVEELTRQKAPAAPGSDEHAAPAAMPDAGEAAEGEPLRDSAASQPSKPDAPAARPDPADFLSEAPDTLPNVLGLRRQDRS